MLRHYIPEVKDVVEVGDERVHMRYDKSSCLLCSSNDV